MPTLSRYGNPRGEHVALRSERLLHLREVRMEARHSHGSGQGDRLFKVPRGGACQKPQKNVRLRGADLNR